MNKICEWCHQDYEGTKSSRYCKRDHYIPCEVCSKSILIREMKRPQRSCSPKCAKVLNRPKPIPKTCEDCGKLYQATKKTDRYCSNDHYTTCVVCGTEFIYLPYRKKPQTCSKKCAAAITDFDARNAKTTATIQEKYGVDNVSQSSEIKEKKRQTLLANYGVENPSQSKKIQDKRVETFVERFGTTNPYQNAEVQEKTRKTNRERYGTNNPFANEEVKSKIRETLLKKYGVDNISKLPEIRERVRKTTLERYGVEFVFQLPENQLKSSQNNGFRISKINHAWQSKLKSALDVDFAMEVPFANRYYADLGLGNVLIDINPTFTHNSSVSFVHATRRCSVPDCTDPRHLPRDPNYHQSHALAAANEGKLLCQYFDWYDPNLFVDVVRSKLHLDQHRIGARQTELHQVPQAVANRFLRDNHLMGASTNQTVCLGLFFNDELVHVQTYGPARMNRNIEWEAIRSASKRSWHIQGAFTKCDNFFHKHHHPASMVSYVDLSISNGELETRFDGWKLLRTNKPSAMWVNLVDNDNPTFIRDSTARRVSADRLLGFEPGTKYPLEVDGAKVTNDFVLLSEGFVKMFDAGTRTFVWNK